MILVKRFNFRKLENLVLITVEHLQMSQILALNNP